MKVLFFSGVAAALLVIAASSAWAADGEAVYNANCGACHNAMSPKLGDKAAWAPLIKQGTDALVAAVIKGKGMMPPRGGHADLSDADIRAAVQYIESKAQ
jgi:cytochrome c5